MLDKKDRQKLITIAQTLEPLLILGKNGLSDNVLTEMEDILDAREILKVRILRSCEVTAREISEIAFEQLSAETVTHLGNVVVLYRRSTRDKVKHIL